ncbi:hypothetical protein [Saccharothrix syringae]|nr:hypothetical protein [Saccharothrix syringae]
MIIGISGHQNLPEAARRRAEDDIRALLRGQHEPFTGMASLAEGADQLFAELVLAAGGKLHAVIPSLAYETTFRGNALDTYLRLLDAAADTTRLPFDVPDESAYHAAGNYIVEHCDLLVAVWDGQPARGLGGTGDAVAHARMLGREVLVSWPQGVQRA